MGWPEFYEQAVHGIVDVRMARSAGLAERTVRRHAEIGAWTPEHPSVWRLPSHLDTPHSRLAAAIRLAGPGARADRHTALALHGLVSAYPTRHQLLLPHTNRLRTYDGIEVRRTRHLADDELAEVDGLPTLRVARILLNGARDLRTRPLLGLALAAVRDGHMDLDELAKVVDRYPCAPCRRRVLRVVDALRRDGSDSGLEFRTRDRLHEEGFRPDPQQPRVAARDARRRIDIGWNAYEVGVDCHGYRFHAPNSALDRDVVRLNGLVSAGAWLILQVTPTILHEAWGDFVLDLRTCLRRRAIERGLPMPPGADGP